MLSAALREASDRGNARFVTTHTIPDLIESVSKPRDPLEAIDRLLLWVMDRTASAVDYIPLQPANDYPVIAAENAPELNFIIQKARDLDYLEMSNEGARLDLEGWKRVAELRTYRPHSDQAFVAMWFDASLNDAWENGMKPAVIAAGYRPYRVDQQEHNDKIDDLIIAEIRRSAVVVADFTGHRGGVYFEAGFAMGLGIPVIRTCRIDDMDKLHFDTRQYNHVAWSDPTDLLGKLRLRIEATVPRVSGGSRSA